MEKHYITLNDQTVLLMTRRNKAAKRVTLRLTPSCDGVIMTLPMRANMQRAMGFLHQKASWVLSHVVAGSPKIPLADGATISLLGKDYTIEHVSGRGVTRLHGGKLQVFGSAEFTARRVKDFLKKYLQELSMRQATAMAAALGKTVRSVRIGDMRSRWGSCTVAGALAFNWRLIFAPAEILDYLIAHEVAHLVEMNHSQRFWKRVAELYPDYVKARAWLKREGQILYRYE